MREQLWGIARGSSSEELAPAAFRQSLAALCRSIEAGSGLLALRDGDGYRVHASQHSLPEGEILQLDGEIEGDLMEEGGHLAPSLHWIAPCTWKDETLGLVAVGVRQPGGAYNEEDLDLLTEFADQVALLVHLESLKTEQRARLEKLAGEYQRDQVHLQAGTEHIVDTVTHRPDKELVRWVEDALRNLADISHLGQSPLVAHLGIRGETHLVRGQALRGKILEILEVLRPPGERPPEPLPREWYSYAVLHDAYVEDVPNREIMARLYISEGTFNRTRRKAIRAMARSILELQVVD